MNLSEGKDKSLEPTYRIPGLQLILREISRVPDYLPFFFSDPDPKVLSTGPDFMSVSSETTLLCGLSPSTSFLSEIGLF